MVQLSDLHIGADWAGVDAGARLEAAIAAVGRLRDVPSVVLLSGDVAHNASDEEYELARSLVARLDIPIFALPGNRDDRETLRRHFEIPGSGSAPIDYAADLGPVRLVVIDSTVPGESRGALSAPQLAWLDRQLALAPRQLTVLAMHHPPIASISPEWDEAVGFAPADRVPLAEVLSRHPQVRLIVAGHVHRTIPSELAGRTVVSAPSTYMQMMLSADADDAQLCDEPPGYAVHALIAGEVRSEVHAFGV